MVNNKKNNKNKNKKWKILLFCLSNIPPRNKKTKFIEQSNISVRGSKKINMKTFPWYFFSLFLLFSFFLDTFPTCFLGNFFYWLLKWKIRKKFYSVGNSANETLFLLNIKTKNFTARSVLLILHQKSHHEIKSKRGEKKVLIIYIFCYLRKLSYFAFLPASKK